MPTPPPYRSIIQNLDSLATKPQDFKRRQISDILHHIGDIVYIVDLNYNGTILGFEIRYVLVLPHNYGGPIKRAPQNIRPGSGITGWQRQWMNQIHVYYHDHQ